ncbi:anticodon-binding domain-containing protein [Umbelopsis sp. AD052]|nr:anticodon-binding domain-containing protein [Umbelopsis sp. AD052]
MNPVKGEENTMAPASTTLSTTPGSSIAGNKRLDSFIDSEIKIRTVDNEEISGKLFTVDPITSCLALSCQKISLNGQQSQKDGFRIIKISHIKELISFEPKNRKKPAELAKDSIETVYAQASSAPRKVYIDQINQREAEAIKLASQQAARIGVGVSKDAQAIFDALSKTLPCRWAKDSIVVMDEVIISPPYNEENCRANPSSTASLARVKKVLEGEKKRLGATSK